MSHVDTREVDVDINNSLLAPSDVEMTVAEQSLQQRQVNSGVEGVEAELDENRGEIERHMTMESLLRQRKFLCHWNLALNFK